VNHAHETKTGDANANHVRKSLRMGCLWILMFSMLATVLALFGTISSNVLAPSFARESQLRVRATWWTVF
jgi:hypothetical protein